MTEPRSLRKFFGLNQYEAPADDKEHRWPELLGVELELEGRRPEDAPDYTMWDKHEDGSLRNGTEYTFSGPLSGKNIDLALNSFYRVPMDWGKGARTSTHIHINMADTTDQHLRMMFLLVYTIEDAIFAATEEGRKWAGYSVPLNEMAPDRIRGILNPFNDDVFTTSVAPARNAERYYGFNVGSIRRHGTVEFRYFPGGPSREELESWMDLVTSVKRATADMTLETMVEAFSSEERAADFLRTRLGAWGNRLISVRGIGEMLMRFAEVAPMAGDADNRHAFGLVYSVNPLYFGLLKKHTLRDEEKAIKLLLKYKDITPLHTATDWLGYLEQAIYMIPREKHPGYKAKAAKKTGLEGQLEALAAEAMDPFGHPEPPEGWDEPDWAEPPDEMEDLPPSAPSLSPMDQESESRTETTWGYVSVQNGDGSRYIVREQRFTNGPPERRRVTDYNEYLTARQEIRQMPERWRGEWYGPSHASPPRAAQATARARLDEGMANAFYTEDNRGQWTITTNVTASPSGIQFSQPATETPLSDEERDASLEALRLRMQEQIERERAARVPNPVPPPSTQGEALGQINGESTEDRSRRLAAALQRVNRLAGEDWSHFWNRVRDEANNSDW